LRNTEIKRGNVWDFSLAVEEKKIKVAIAVIRAEQPIIGMPAQKLEKVLGYAC
jgi:hypothetical protein